MSVNGFECGKCKRRFPYSDGNATSFGLVCRGCTPQLSVDEGARAQANDPSAKARSRLTFWFAAEAVFALLRAMFTWP